MPNGGTNVPADDLATYRKSEVAELQASHARLLEACKALLACSLPTDISGRAMVDQAVAAIAKAEGKP